MATAAVDHTMNIWDVRNLSGPLQKYFLHSTATNLNFSQKSHLALSLGNVVEVCKHCCPIKILWVTLNFHLCLFQYFFRSIMIVAQRRLSIHT